MPLTAEQKHDNRITKILENIAEPWNGLRLSTIKAKRLKPQFCLLRRLESADSNGYVMCVTCGLCRQWNDRMHGGHWIHGLSPGLLTRENIHVQCNQCNTFVNVGGKYDEFMSSKYGDELEGIAVILQLNKTNQYDWTRREMVELYIHWGELIKVEKRRIGV